MSLFLNHIKVQYLQQKRHIMFALQPCLYMGILVLFFELGHINLPSKNWALPAFLLFFLVTLQRHAEILFVDDYQSGALDQYVLHNQVLPYCLSHVIVWWSMSLFPLCCFTSLAIWVTGTAHVGLFFLVLLLITFTAAWICALSSALSVVNSGIDFVKSLIALPLLIAVFLLGLSAYQSANLWWLISLGLLSFSLVPTACSAALVLATRYK